MMPPNLGNGTVMKKFFAAAVIAVAAAMPAFAADQIAPERLALARQVMELSGANKVYDGYDKKLDAMVDQLRPAMPGADQTVIADIKKIALEEFNVYKPELMNGAVNVYARHFSEADLRALIAFYKSDAGRHFAAELPAVSQECIQLSAPFTKRMMERVQKYIADKAAADNASESQEQSKDK